MEYVPCQNVLHGPDHEGCPECHGEGEVPAEQIIARVALFAFAVMHRADPDEISVHDMNKTGGLYRCPVGRQTAVIAWVL